MHEGAAWRLVAKTIGTTATALDQSDVVSACQAIKSHSYEAVMDRSGPEAKRIAEVDRIPARKPIQIEPPGEPDRVFLGALDRLEGPSYCAALQVG